MKNKNAKRNLMSEAEREVKDLLNLLEDNGVDKAGVWSIINMLLEMGELNGEAMVEVERQVKLFLTGKIPEPSENGIINLTVISIMEVVLNAKGDSIVEKYINNRKNKKGKK